MSMDVEYARRRRYTHDTFDFPREFEHRADSHHRRGSLCDRHCSGNLQADLVDTHSGSHQHSLLTPRLLPGAISSASCCLHHSGEVQPCDLCLVKTTITAENEVEALKLSNNYKFGFKKWKSHITERPWEDRSDIVKELYSDLNVVKMSVDSTVTFGNILYLLLFGWWISLFYFLISFMMFISILGFPYGVLCWRLAKYFVWPFGKVILKNSRTHRKKLCVRFCKCEAIPEVDELEKSPLVEKCEQQLHADSHVPDVNYWSRASTYIWLLGGYPVLAVVHGLACFFSWIFVFFIPVSKMNGRVLSTVLLMPPEHVHIRQGSKVGDFNNAEVVLCCYYAVNVYYYKFSVDGLNVFAVNLIVLVIVSLILGYVDSNNFYTSSPVKFTLSLLSIMPLSYYIGMAIASISAQSNFALGAVVNATFGSIIELTFYITALIKGVRENDKCYEEVVKSALTGTLLGCVLFVPGLCMIIGGIKHREQRFNSRSAGVGSALLFISVGGVFAPTLFSKVYGKMVCGNCMNFGQNGTDKYICQNCHTELMGQNSTVFYGDIKWRRRLRARRRRQRRYWVHPIPSERSSLGVFQTLFPQLRDYPESFFNYFRMSIENFDELLQRVSPHIQRQDTTFRRSVSPAERLMLTIRFLATGETFTSLHYQFRLGISTVSVIVKDTCHVLWEILHDEFIPHPTAEKWLEIADKFWEVCNFPNCLGAVDGKHIRIIKPRGTGSEYFNYKKYFSIILMAIADAQYRFVAVDVGAYGRTNDSMVFKNSFMGRSLYNRQFNFPSPKPLPGTDSPPMPYVLVADEAFQMCGNLLKPYSSRGLDQTRRTFNYRLTRARRMVECTFGILVAKWQIFTKPINLKIETVDDVVKCAVVLHNFLISKSPPTVEQIPEQSEMASIQNFGPRSSVAVARMRDSFADYFCSDVGRVDWQDQFV